MLHCTRRVSSPCSSNSRWHQVRAKNPRVSQRGSMSTTNAPSSPAGVNRIGLRLRRATASDGRSERSVRSRRRNAGPAQRTVEPTGLLQLLDMLDPEISIADKLGARKAELTV